MTIGLQFFGTDMTHQAFFVIGIKRPLVKLSGTTDKNVYIKFGGKKFGAMHFIYYINRSIATKVDSTYLGY